MNVTYPPELEIDSLAHHSSMHSARTLCIYIHIDSATYSMTYGSEATISHDILVRLVMGVVVLATGLAAMLTVLTVTFILGL